MKKKGTYPLLLLVIVVWGLIIYRVVHGSGTPDSGAVRPLQHVLAGPDTAQAKQPDTLLLNYSDPFLGVQLTEQPVLQSEEMMEAAPQVPAEPDWSMIGYRGSIVNPQGGKQVFLLQINGASHLMKTGEVKDGLTLLKGDDKAISVSYQEKTNTIYKQE